MISLPNSSFTFTDIPPYVRVGKYSSIARDVYFHDPNDQHLAKYNKKCVYTTNWDQIGDPREATVIGNDVWVGMNVKFLFGVKVGDGAIIGAHSVIAKDVPPYAVVVGNPQVIKRYRFTKSQIKKLLKMNWWDWEEDKIGKAKEDMKDIDVFLANYE